MITINLSLFKVTRKLVKNATLTVHIFWHFVKIQTLKKFKVDEAVIRIFHFTSIYFRKLEEFRV